jgi:predicted ribonuclease toxin of YeeF-YezG toxin-antitoxin module
MAAVQRDKTKITAYKRAGAHLYILKKRFRKVANMKGTVGKRMLA